MAFRGSPLGFSAALAGLPVVLMLAQPLLCLCHMKGPFTHTHAAVAYAENGGNGITGGHGEESYANSLEQAGADAHLWEATCSSYKSITVRFPEIHALATYDLKQIVQGAPPTGWACKASEPLFELDEYPPFFRSMLSLMFGNDKDLEEKPQTNKLHKHKNKHVFFAFNPCRLLPHTCHGSRGRLFKFAAKLKTPNDPHEEIQRLLADLLKEPSSPSTTSAAQKGEEEADTTECLQNVLAANTTLLYSYRDKNKQQHPDSNGIGALWSQPEITDDPTPWEPLNTDDPFEGLQAHMHHVHIFCPDSSLHTHVVLKCPRAGAGGRAASATTFDLCEHPDPCRFNMVMTTPAACPTVVDYTGSTTIAANAASPALFSGKALLNANTEGKDKTNISSASTGEPAMKKDSSSEPALAASAGAEKPPSSSTEQQSSRKSEIQQNPVNIRSGSGGDSEGAWQGLLRLLVLCVRVGLCCLVFAWLIYAIKDWKETKMQYAPLPDERQLGEDATSTGNVNSYDSCVKALAEATCIPKTDDTRGFQLATKYTDPPTDKIVGGEGVGFSGTTTKAPRRELRGLYSSPGRRLVSVWLPQTVDFTTRQVLAFSTGAVNACRKFVRAFNPTRGAAGEFAQSNVVGGGTPWDWTDNIEFNDTQTHTPTANTPRHEVLGGLSGYETIS